MSSEVPSPNAAGKALDTASPASRSGIALAIIVSCQLMFTLDLMIVTVALPSIATDLGYSETGLAWVVNAYGLALGGLMLLGGRMGDIFGRRRVLMAGVAVFTAASLLAGFATTDWWFLVGRALHGVGAAMAMPTTLALIVSLFKEGPERTKAIATYSAVSSSGAVVGLLLGGVLLTGLSWRWVMFVNVPIGILLLVLMPMFISEQPRIQGRFDLAGAITSAMSVASLVYGLSNAGHHGWASASTSVPLIGGACPRNSGHGFRYRDREHVRERSRERPSAGGRELRPERKPLPRFRGSHDHRRRVALTSLFIRRSNVKEVQSEVLAAQE